MEEVEVREDPAAGRFTLQEGPQVMGRVVVAAI